MVALSGTEVASVAERIRRAIALPTDPLVTASIGVATAESGTDGQFDVLLKCADDAMYQAKRLGGDQVILAALPLPISAPLYDGCAPPAAASRYGR